MLHPVSATPTLYEEAAGETHLIFYTFHFYTEAKYKYNTFVFASICHRGIHRPETLSTKKLTFPSSIAYKSVYIHDSENFTEPLEEWINMPQSESPETNTTC